MAEMSTVNTSRGPLPPPGPALGHALGPAPCCLALSGPHGLLLTCSPSRSGVVIVVGRHSLGFSDTLVQKLL